jgi:hypothetical protein
MSADIRFSYEETAERVEALGALVDELTQLIGRESLESVVSIAVVEDGDVAATVNGLIDDNGAQGAYTANPSHPATGVAVPLETGDEVRVVIVLCRSLLRPIGAAYRHAPDTVSTVLEELLHARVYAAAKRRRGYVHHRGETLLACDADLLTAASQMCDEYFVIRCKAQTLAEVPLLEPNRGQGRVCAELRYGASLEHSVSVGTGEIEAAVRDAACGARGASDSWALVVGLLYRRLLEPLARSAAYLDAASSPVFPDMSENRLYHELIHLRWLAMRDGLRRVFASRLQETEVVVAEIHASLRAVLGDMGVSYRRTERGECWVEFRPRHAGQG